MHGLRNGGPVTEYYTPDLLESLDHGPDVVPPGQRYLLGENRFGSIDSRNVGTVPVDTVVGRGRRPAAAPARAGSDPPGLPAAAPAV